MSVCPTWTNKPNLLDVDQEDERDADASNALDTQSGHGTFIAGIVSRLAPEVDVAVHGVLNSFGDGDDFTIATGLDEAIPDPDDEPDVLVLSLGCYTDDDLPPPIVAARLRQLKRTVIVAAAGNYGSCRPFWPAAMRRVVGVGALDSVTKAWFSNWGPWVDACAPGVDVVSTFFEPDGTFATTGWARWSGTSFAAPKVAAAIADAQWRAQEPDARPAKARLLRRYGLFRIPELGVVVNLW
jgi:subtilisin family serine protease